MSYEWRSHQNKKYCEQLITVVKDIFGCQQRHTFIMNIIIYDANTSLFNENEQLKGLSMSWNHVDILVAAKKLALP